MGRWLIAQTKINDNETVSKVGPDTNKPLNDTDDIGIDQLEKDENVWKETFNENRNTDGVIGAKENGREPFITIFDGHK